MNESQMNLPLGRVLKKRGMKKAYDAEAEYFKFTARNAITVLAAQKSELTSNDLWRMMPEGVCPKHPNSVGAIFRWAASAGIIESTGRIAPSEKITSHASLVLVWRSKIFQGGKS